MVDIIEVISLVFENIYPQLRVEEVLECEKAKHNSEKRFCVTTLLEENVDQMGSKASFLTHENLCLLWFTFSNQTKWRGIDAYSAREGDY